MSRTDLGQTDRRSTCNPTLRSYNVPTLPPICPPRQGEWATSSNWAFFDFFFESTTRTWGPNWAHQRFGEMRNGANLGQSNLGKCVERAATSDQQERNK